MEQLLDKKDELKKAEPELEVHLNTPKKHNTRQEKKKRQTAKHKHEGCDGGDNEDGDEKEEEWE
eukprot:CAMPEP_0198210186 /NCGR_PEP_ID=MMETSP1445-20131203/19946_1 /TAXON_ID=36898 /ORGANISM="Pyramimonas sp., Strain CCMP2087" /LENGTH=63 /DNA_ID=CAMNT_0043884181 /DNA_START=107 /DNA_END=298 /DNA_ORIENTATION=+